MDKIDQTNKFDEMDEMEKIDEINEFYKIDEMDKIVENWRILKKQDLKILSSLNARVMYFPSALKNTLRIFLKNQVKKILGDLRKF